MLSCYKTAKVEGGNYGPMSTIDNVYWWVLLIFLISLLYERESYHETKLITKLQIGFEEKGCNKRNRVVHFKLDVNFFSLLFYYSLYRHTQDSILC
jgi:hypothetical protein